MVRLLHTIFLALVFVLPAYTFSFEDKPQTQDQDKPQSWKDGSPSDDCVWTCGVACYWLLDVHRAMRRAHQLHASGQVIQFQDSTNDGYPHAYENHEDFDFPTPGPWYEFPIMWDFQVYDGGDPGPDRVIIDSSGQLEGLITHTGAPSADAFVMCVHGDA